MDPASRGSPGIARGDFSEEVGWPRPRSLRQYSVRRQRVGHLAHPGGNLPGIATRKRLPRPPRSCVLEGSSPVNEAHAGLLPRIDDVWLERVERVGRHRALAGAECSLAPISACIAAVILLRVAVNVTTRLAAENSPRNRSRSAHAGHDPPIPDHSPALVRAKACRGLMYLILLGIRRCDRGRFEVGSP
jgi:hypothetical protein